MVRIFESIDFSASEGQAPKRAPKAVFEFNRLGNNLEFFGAKIQIGFLFYAKEKKNQNSATIFTPKKVYIQQVK